MFSKKYFFFQLLKKSVIVPDFEKKDAIPPYRESKHAAKLKRKVGALFFLFLLEYVKIFMVVFSVKGCLFGLFLKMHTIVLISVSLLNVIACPDEP